MRCAPPPDDQVHAAPRGALDLRHQRTRPSTGEQLGGDGDQLLAGRLCLALAQPPRRRDGSGDRMSTPPTPRTESRPATSRRGFLFSPYTYQQYGSPIFLANAAGGRTDDHLAPRGWGSGPGSRRLPGTGRVRVKVSTASLWSPLVAS